MDLTAAFDEIQNNAAKRMQQNEGDYFVDGLLHCCKCHKPKQTRKIAFGVERIFPCICQCVVEENRRIAEEKERQEFLERIKRLRKMGFPDAEMARWTFANDDLSNKRISDIAQKYAENFQEMKKRSKGLLFYGNVGAGKSFISVCIANALIDKGYPCLVTNFPRLTNTLQGMFEGKQEYIDGLNNFDLLVVDDLAAERDTEYMNETIQNIIDARYRSGLPIIVTTNLTAKELYNPADVKKQRTYSRLLEMCYPVYVEHRDRRKDIAVKEKSEIEELLGL